MKIGNPNYKVLYELEKQKTKRLKEKNIYMANALGINSFESSISSLINQENEPHRVNIANCNNLKRKKLDEVHPVVSDFSLDLSYRLHESKHKNETLTEVLIGSVKKIGYENFQNEIMLSWNFQEMCVLSQTKFNLTNIPEIKSLVSNIPPVVYRYQQLTQQYGYVAELHRFNKDKVTYFLSVVVLYREKENYYYPEIHCYLSEIQPNINYMLLQLNMQLSINPEKLFNRIDILHNLNSLYLFYRESCGMLFLDQLILSIMLEKSILIRGKSNKHVCEFVYLLSHYSGIPLGHVNNYQVVDSQLLDLPVPYIFGSTEPSLLSISCQTVIILDMDKCRVFNLQKLKTDFDVRSFVAHLFSFLESTPHELDIFQLIQKIQQHFQKSPLRYYMIQFVRTITFHDLYQKHKF